jgi:hypothetical protein
MPYALCLNAGETPLSAHATALQERSLPYVLCLMPYALCLNAGETPLSAHATALKERSLEKLQGKIGTPFT